MLDAISVVGAGAHRAALFRKPGLVVTITAAVGSEHPTAYPRGARDRPRLFGWSKVNSVPHGYRMPMAETSLEEYLRASGIREKFHVGL